MHESLDALKFWPDTNTNTRVTCPCASDKLMYNVVSTIAPSFLIRSSSYLQVMRTSITSRTRSKFCQIGPRTAELAALETYNGRNLVNTLAPSIFDSINLILAGKEDMHESLDEIEFRIICNRVTALDLRQNCVFAQYLENE